MQQTSTQELLRADYMGPAAALAAESAPKVSSPQFGATIRYRAYGAYWGLLGSVGVCIGPVGSQPFIWPPSRLRAVPQGQRTKQPSSERYSHYYSYYALHVQSCITMPAQVCSEL